MSLTDSGSPALPMLPGNDPHIVVIGGGFGGLAATKSLARATVRVTLIDPRNYHLFQPLLYQVATAALSPADIATPLRRIFRRHENVAVVMAAAISIDMASKRVQTSSGEISYDGLIVSAGAESQYFRHPEWETIAPGLKGVEDALTIRNRIFASFESAEQEITAEVRQALMTFIVVGGGPTGVEMAGSIAEIAHDTLAREFRFIDPAEARVVLVEGGDRILSAFPEDLSSRASEDLRALGIELRTGTMVTDIQPGLIQLGDEVVSAHTVVWAAGVRASPMASSFGAPVDRSGRVIVQGTLNLEQHPEVFVIGDMAAVPVYAGGFQPGLAPVAMQEGELAAKNMLRLFAGEPLSSFIYRDRGTMATIGRNRAVGIVFGRHLTGFVAWIAWLFVHLMMLVGFRNRISVLFQWGWSYLTRQRPGRLISQNRPGNDGLERSP